MTTRDERIAYLHRLVALADKAKVAPLYYSTYGSSVSEGGKGVFCDIRGWGHLSQGLSESEAVAVQDARGQLVAAGVPLLGDLARALLFVLERREVNGDDILGDGSIRAAAGLNKALAANPQPPDNA